MGLLRYLRKLFWDLCILLVLLLLTILSRFRTGLFDLILGGSFDFGCMLFILFDIVIIGKCHSFYLKATCVDHWGSPWAPRSSIQPCAQIGVLLTFCWSFLIHDFVGRAVNRIFARGLNGWSLYLRQSVTVVQYFFKYVFDRIRWFSCFRFLYLDITATKWFSLRLSLPLALQIGQLTGHNITPLQIWAHSTHGSLHEVTQFPISSTRLSPVLPLNFGNIQPSHLILIDSPFLNLVEHLIFFSISDLVRFISIWFWFGWASDCVNFEFY